ncbi:hypothetical protein RHECNPAF_1740077 [Rhizobium etli CNPAF512]|nr:hypothetical protein RHECNPAF_1740077 [Rhizobium etli CNPAF512]
MPMKPFPICVPFKLLRMYGRPGLKVSARGEFFTAAAT